VDIPEQLTIIRESISLLIPELVLSCAILALISLGLFKKITPGVFSIITSLFFLSVIIITISELHHTASIFQGMMRKESFSSYLKILMNIAGLITCLMSFVETQRPAKNVSEYYALILATVLGGHLLVMSHNAVMVFLSLELISISSYVLAGYANTKAGSEGSLKYFLFGSVAAAVMLYGFSILYGLTGTLDFSSSEFADQLIQQNSPLGLVAALMVLAGFLFKIAAAPMHLWAPDVYEAAPIPVLAFLSVAPKLAGLGIFTKFIFTINLFGQSTYDWQWIVAAIAIVTLTVGNFAALTQTSAKRMMAYSSIAQSGFLLVGIAAFLPQGIHVMLFYASVYTLMNFSTFIFLKYFEDRNIKTIAEFSGAGKDYLWPMVFLLISLIALTGLPPTSGFTAKLFIFSSLFESYEFSNKSVLLWLLIFGLLNTVVSLFYYLKIPYYAFLKQGDFAEKRNNITSLNLLGFILVLLILVLFFMPGLLMGWINKINFVF
jgi:NADH-quinone oxidoreductase subunit N